MANLFRTECPKRKCAAKTQNAMCVHLLRMHAHAPARALPPAHAFAPTCAPWHHAFVHSPPHPSPRLHDWVHACALSPRACTCGPLTHALPTHAHVVPAHALHPTCAHDLPPTHTSPRTCMHRPPHIPLPSACAAETKRPAGQETARVHVWQG